MSYVNLIDIVYPVGTIYLSTSRTSPTTLFGGTWSAVSGGVLKPSTSNCGSYTGNKQLQEANIPNHKHWIQYSDSVGNVTHADIYLSQFSSNVGGGSGWGVATSGNSSADSGFISWWIASQVVHSSVTDVNLYGYNVYCWQRTK